MSIYQHISATLDRIRSRNSSINAFVDLTPERALRRAADADQAPIPENSAQLLGVPFAVKNSFDVIDLPTLAGSKINRSLAPATADATLIQRLEKCGGVLVGTLNMDEYASGYSTENTHYGVTRNPHDTSRVTGGSSGGSAAAVAAGLVPLSLGSDTTGSIRVPAALCGVWGLKPTYGRLSRAGTFPFCNSLDTVGPLACSLEMLAAAYDAMQGPDLCDPVCRILPPAPLSADIDLGIKGLRIARAVGYFEAHAQPEVVEIVKRAAVALGCETTIDVPDAERAGAAALVITRSESGQLHLNNLRLRADEFDPLIRDRLLSNALIPVAWYLHAQRFRRRHYQQLLKLFEKVDVVLAPATPAPAHRIGEKEIAVRDKTLSTRAAAGRLTEPWSLTGLPVLCAPVGTLGGLPVGLQIIAAPWEERLCFRVARELERNGVAKFVGA